MVVWYLMFHSDKDVDCGLLSCELSGGLVGGYQ
jgi:hypothetical protein